MKWKNAIVKISVSERCIFYNFALIEQKESGYKQNFQKSSTEIFRWSWDTRFGSRISIGFGYGSRY